MTTRNIMFAEFNKLAAAAMASPVAARRADAPGEVRQKLMSAPKPPSVATPNPTQASPSPNPIRTAPPPPVQ